jgi:multidrug efflux system membrane fusion protein
MNNLRGPIRVTQLPTRLPKRFRRRHIWYALPILAAILLLIFLLTQSHTTKKPERAVPVSIDVVRMQSVPILLRSIGTVTAVNSVAIKPHVNGQIMQTYFREGQPVTAGQLLFAIDPRPLQAALSQQNADVQSKAALVAQAQAAISKDQALLAQATANIEKDKAVAVNAGVESKRYQLLAKEGAVSQEQADQFRTAYTSAQATVRADEANAGNVRAAIAADRANLLSARAQLSASQAMLQNAQVQLSYASIRAPISGVAGNIQILTGNVVRQDTDVLVTINQIQPINVNLTVPEPQFDDVRRYAAAGPILAEVFDSNGNAIASGGRLIFQNNTVDAQTGTVLLKVTFDNTTAKLWPGQFVNTVLTLSVIPSAIVVPSQAVQNGLNGTFVWMLKKEKNTAYMQPVTVGETSGAVTVITSGVRPGQEIITDGQLQLSPGAHVSISKMRGL